MRTAEGTYTPRAVLVDTDPAAAAAAAVAMYGAGCPAVVTGFGGTGGNWARGYRAASDVAERAAEAVRVAAERCDRVQGVQTAHSLGGGTGAGLGARVVEDVRTALANRPVHTYTVVPRWTAAAPAGPRDCAAGAHETCNAALCLARLMDECAHAAYMTDNRRLYEACAGPLAIGAPTYADLNHLIAQTMASGTTAYRFAPGGGGEPDADADADMGKRAARLVPYARLRFFATGFAPLTHRGQTERPATDAVPGLAARLFDDLGRRRRGQLLMAAACTFRGTGPLLPADVLAVRRTAHAFTDHCGCWLPDNVTAAGYDVRSRGIETSGSVVANTTAIADVFRSLCRR